MASELQICILVLPRLAYLTLCRSVQLLVLLARGDAAKDMEILVLRHQLVERRTKEGLSKPEIMRCIKHYPAREVYHALVADFQALHAT